MNNKDADKKILVIGMELEGIILSNELVNKGYKVILIDNKDYLGGRLKNNRLSFLSFMLEEKIKSLENNKNIQILKNTSLLSVNGSIGSFNVTLLDSKKSNLDVSVIVISSGTDLISTFDYTGDNFISFNQLNKFFNPEGITRADILKIANRSFKKIAFYIPQDSSSRYMVNEFFQYALFFKKRYGADVNLILPQVLIAGDELEKSYREIREAGILVFKYDNQPVLEYIDLNDVIISFKDQIEGEIKLEFDLFVYCEKISGSSYFKELISTLRISELNNINFQLLSSSRKGVYFCGLCREDLLNKECVQDAIALADEIDGILKNGKIEYENGTINIDKHKCTLCITCVRACPHGAIEMDRDVIEERVIKIYDEACFHCGTCVGECPTKALTYKEELVSI